MRCPCGRLASEQFLDGLKRLHRSSSSARLELARVGLICCPTRLCQPRRRPYPERSEPPPAARPLRRCPPGGGRPRSAPAARPSSSRAPFSAQQLGEHDRVVVLAVTGGVDERQRSLARSSAQLAQL